MVNGMRRFSPLTHHLVTHHMPLVGPIPEMQAEMQADRLSNSTCLLHRTKKIPMHRLLLLLLLPPPPPPPPHALVMCTLIPNMLIPVRLVFFAAFNFSFFGHCAFLNTRVVLCPDFDLFWFNCPLCPTC